MIRFFLLVILIGTTMADHGTPWHIKLAYQNIDIGLGSSRESVDGILFGYEKLFNRQVHSYFSTFTEVSFNKYSESSNQEIILFHGGTGIKWNFGPTDFDYEPAIDYEFVLNQGSLYIKAGVGYTNYESEETTQNSGLIIDKQIEISSQYGVGYELLGKRTGFYFEYMKSNAQIYNRGILRAGINWKF